MEEINFLLKTAPDNMKELLDWAHDRLFDVAWHYPDENADAVKLLETTDYLTKQVNEQLLIKRVYDSVSTPGKWYILESGRFRFIPDAAPGIESYTMQISDSEKDKWFLSQELDDGFTEIFPDVAFADMVDELNSPEVHMDAESKEAIIRMDAELDAKLENETVIADN